MLNAILILMIVFNFVAILIDISVILGTYINNKYEDDEKEIGHNNTVQVMFFFLLTNNVLNICALLDILINLL